MPGYLASLSFAAPISRIDSDTAAGYDQVLQFLGWLGLLD